MDVIKNKINLLKDTLKQKNDEIKKYEDEKKNKSIDLDKIIKSCEDEIEKCKNEKNKRTKAIDEKINNCYNETNKIKIEKEALQKKVDFHLETLEYLKKYDDNPYDKEGQTCIYVLSCGIVSTSSDFTTNYKSIIGTYSLYKNAKIMLDQVVSEKYLRLDDSDYTNLKGDYGCREATRFDRYDINTEVEEEELYRMDNTQKEIFKNKMNRSKNLIKKMDCNTKLLEYYVNSYQPDHITYYSITQSNIV